jgi:hypothetical protein
MSAVSFSATFVILEKKKNYWKTKTKENLRPKQNKTKSKFNSIATSGKPDTF